MTHSGGRWIFIAPGIVAAIGAIIAVIVTIGPATTENTSSAGTAGRVPIPGSHVFDLAAKKYAIWYGLDNAPLNYQIHLPPLSFDIKPPAGVADPVFTESHGTEDDSHSIDIRRVAYVTPSVSGKYTMSVSSANGPGGVLLLGEALPNKSPALLPGGIVLAVSLLIAGGVLLVTRRRVAGRAD